MTLAMADHPTSQFPVTVTTIERSVADNLPAESTNNPPATGSAATAVNAEAPTETQLEKPVRAGQADGLRLVHKDVSAAGGATVAISLQAGYGRIWDEQSILSKISTGHQETACAYVGAKISF